MFRELAALGKKLEAERKLKAPIGFYNYREPIRWIVHLFPDHARLSKTEIACPRPFDGRTSAIRAHPLVDEAAYALGVTKKKKGSDRRAKEKHRKFLELLKKFLASPHLKDPALHEALEWLMKALEEKWVQKDPRFGEIEAKDWVSFMPEEGTLKGQHLFELPDVKEFWIAELEERSLPEGADPTVRGECAVCGQRRPLVGKIPKVKLTSTVPLHSLNADAFVSHVAGREAFKHARLGLCFVCGDLAARAFNYLSNSDLHRKNLVWDSKNRDGLTNQIALFWLKERESPIQIGEIELSSEEFLKLSSAVLAEERVQDEVQTPQSTLSQLDALLDLPWKPKESNLRLDDYGFYLAVLSPNVGRIAVREWISVSLRDLKERLKRFLEATRIVSPWGDEPRPLSIRALVSACEGAGPNITRGLLRTAFLGYVPPHELLEAALRRFRLPNVLQDPRNTRQGQALAAALKLQLFYGKEEVRRMEQLDPQRKSQAYLCGRLLAVLEEAQQKFHIKKHGKRVDTTIVNRFYGSASTAPATTFGVLLRLATTAHLQEVGREVNELVEEILSLLDEAGGFPKTLSQKGQAEFALGFYHQRAYFRAQRGKKEPQAGEEEQQSSEEEG
ncbi:type I-C CRISPR-associated protein Cas8c/Csd1 [Candidatus Bipolaricaulota bacterium]|nr:type I-C CRISPR-associated protein Cas8c/Csd1 [Candidatus Bipolaricaulota bacterium]